MKTCGVVYVVYGEAAEVSLDRALIALKNFEPHLQVKVYRHFSPGLSYAQNSRLAKVTLLDWSPFDYTVYLDADTQIYQSIQSGFEILKDGWDVAIAPSQNQDQQALWHVGEADKEVTITQLGFNALQLQAGVFFVTKNERTCRLWSLWQDEWNRFQNQDQGALLRALYRNPVKIWMLSRLWNGADIIGHHWGSIRRG